jgi:hypothetical protein
MRLTDSLGVSFRGWVEGAIAAAPDPTRLLLTG